MKRHYTHTFSLLQSEARPRRQNDPESCVVEDPQAGQPGQEDVCKFMHLYNYVTLNNYNS